MYPTGVPVSGKNNTCSGSGRSNSNSLQMNQFIERFFIRSFRVHVVAFGMFLCVYFVMRRNEVGGGGESRQ